MFKGYSYNIRHTQETNTNDYKMFDNNKHDLKHIYSPTYLEILKVFREAFKFVDMKDIIRK